MVPLLNLKTEETGKATIYTMFCFTILSKIYDRSVDKLMLLEELQPTVKQCTLKHSATIAYTPNSLLSAEHTCTSSDAATIKDDTKYNNIIHLLHS